MLEAASLSLHTIVHIAELNTLRPSVLKVPSRIPNPFVMSYGVMTGRYTVPQGRTPGSQLLWVRCRDQAFSFHLSFLVLHTAWESG